MISRKVKRLIVGLGYVLVFLTILSLIVFIFFPKQTPVSGPDKPDTAPLQVNRIKEIYLSDTERDVFAEIENPNDSYGLSSFAYVFVFKNSNGKTRKLRGTTYILPGETRFVTKLSRQIPEQYTLETVNITPQSEWSKLEVDPPRLVIQDLRTRVSQDNRFFVLSGEVINRSPYDLQTVDLNVILENESGNIIGTNATQVNVLRDSETRDFQVRWPRSYADKNIASKRIRPSTNALNSDNILYISDEEEGEFQ